MSSSYIVEPQEIGHEKRDDTLIIVVNDDGTISVDQETLQNLIMNQSNANVSVVRVGQADADTANGDITLTVDPPPFTPTSVTPSNTATDTTGLVDPFMEMDPEQLHRLETALQSEEAKQILGENVTAMLDMLSVEEQQNSIRYSVELDHCYTSRLSPSDPKPRDPLPVDNSPNSADTHYMIQTSSVTSSMTSSISNVDSPTAMKPKQLKTNKPVGRPRKSIITSPAAMTSNSRSNTNTVGTPKPVGHVTSRNLTSVGQQGINKLQNRNVVEDEEDEYSSSSAESSGSEPPSDNDSDFGPRGPRRGGIRARGGRKGLTTRGGSMVAGRRRGPNKQMDMEQVRRLDMEMAAAVNAMKSPEKDERSGRFSPIKGKRQFKIAPGRKKDELQQLDVVQPIGEDTTATYDKPLQTTNQVKANLINANMIKGDMILTKPGQAKTNQKVTFVQKQVLMKPNELKNIGLKKQVMVPKGKFLSQVGTKFFTTKDGKLVQVPVTTKTVSPTQTTTQVKTTLSQTSQIQQPVQVQSQPVQLQQVLKTSLPSVPLKPKPSDTKKEKRKSESIDIPVKPEVDLPKTPDPKALENAKKHQKKDHRKSPGYGVDTLGPALFSTPDIIRRVGSNSEQKIGDSVITTLIPTASPVPTVYTARSSLPTLMVQTATSPGAASSANVETSPISTPNAINKRIVTSPLDPHIQSDAQLSTESDSNLPVQTEEDRQKPPGKAGLSEEIQPSLETGSIEGEEHLLATLEMEASKHEEELLAEALLLQEELGVDLADHPALADNNPVASDTLAQTTMFIPNLIPPDQEEAKPLEAVTTQVAASALREPAKKHTKDEKEPVQIVRGGRVITLPPIEAPATRSKKLQTRAESPPKTVEPVKRTEKGPQTNQQRAQPKEEASMEVNQEEEEEEDDEEEDEEEEDNSDSEDDPDRLWCICKRPHNNRFMICCDVCEDWFHGKCVHVSKAMGQQMEEKGIEWVCPNCLKKKAEEKSKASPQVAAGRQRIHSDTVAESIAHGAVASPGEATSPTVDIATSVPSTPDYPAVQFSGSMQCVVCKKEARNSSIYCSDACILAHAQETLTKDKPSQAPTSNSKMTRVSPFDASKVKPDARVVVFERKTGKVLTGVDAPTRSNLRVWLKENPTFEVVSPNNLHTIQIGGKTVTTIQTQGIGKIMKPTQISTNKLQTLPKMIYTKVTGSKQTVLAPSSKKITIVSSPQQHQLNLANVKTMQLKQTLLANSNKSPLLLKTVSKANLVQAQPAKIQAGASPKQTIVKKQEVKQPPPQPKQPAKIPTPKKPETEPIRLNIRKTLTELLSSRIKETDDLKLTDEEIAELAVNIELELYKYFRDTGAKYKAKYRSLVFNIKDTKNLTLFRKIADRSLTPDAVVRLSPEEMASQELAEWREKETKHQLEMIKKNELDLMTQAKSIVVKTHKGEQIIENDGGIDHVDPKTPVQDIVTALNSGDNISSTVEDGERDTDKEDRLKSKGEFQKSKIGEEKRRKDKERGREKDGARSKGKDRRDRSTSRGRHRHGRDREHSKTRDRSRDRKSMRNKESRREKDRERDKDKERDRNKDREKIRGRDRGKERERHKSSENRSKNRSDSAQRDAKDGVDKKDEERGRKDGEKDETTGLSSDKPIEDRLWRHIEDEATTNTIDGNDSDVSDREPTSTVNIKTPDINEEPERDKDQQEPERETPKGGLQTVWRGFVNMVDVAKFFITAQEVSGHAKDLMDDLPDTVDVVGRISHETVWDYISKMKKTGSKEILVIRLTAANDEEKIPYITLYSYLNSRSRLGVVGNVSKNIKDFYIMPFSSQSSIPPVLLPLSGPGFEEHRPHLLLGIIVRNKRKRLTAMSSSVPMKISKKDTDRSYTPPLIIIPKDKQTSSPPPLSPTGYHKGASNDSTKDKQQGITQITLDTLNKAHIGMSRNIIDSARICKIVPELSSKIDLTSSPGKVALDDDGDEPYSPGEMDDDINVNLRSSVEGASGIMAPSKNSTELQRKMEELNRQIEEQKQQIQNISSSFLADAAPTLPGLGLDPPIVNDSEEAYSPSDSRSFTPPPPSGISKFAQPILDKVSNITIPPNLQEILANVKRQECSKVDPYLPSKPSATFLTTVNSSIYQNTEKYSSPPLPKITGGPSRPIGEKSAFDTAKENKSTLSTLSDLDLIRKAEEELAAVAAAEAMPGSSSTSVLSPGARQTSGQSVTAPSSVPPPVVRPPPPPPLPTTSLFATLPIAVEPESPVEQPGPIYKPSFVDPFKKSFAPEQPKPPGLEDEDFPPFPSTPPSMESTAKAMSRTKFVPKSGIVLSVKRKVSDDSGNSSSPSKAPRTKSRWGQGPSDSVD
ncbi:hypothetical protein KM043_018092 [Ampulex compressa]|nr:hypothetical protein KM043_018092 [Ampulex compressa]